MQLADRVQPLQALNSGIERVEESKVGALNLEIGEGNKQNYYF